MLPPCPSCCSACLEDVSRHQELYTGASQENSAYALGKLLPVGTVVLGVVPGANQAFCDHVHTEDGWHTFRGTSILGQLQDNQSAALCQQLEFLAKHQFISATQRIFGGTELLVRIYLIPHDLANVKGKLRLRKESILAPARRYLRRLLPEINKDVNTWTGVRRGRRVSFVPDTKDSRSLSEIYSELPSPSTGVVPGWEDISTRLLDFSDNLDGLGMRSYLYKYQRQSVAAMMRRELGRSDISDPLFISLTTIDNKTFYLQPGTMEILQERPMVAQCRGGILCEELGTGKTVMILALILATINQLPTPEESIMDDRPVLTPLSFKHFPSLDCITARQRFDGGSQKLSAHTHRVPSLVELLLHHNRTTPVTTTPNTSTQQGMKKYMKRIEMEDSVNSLPVGGLLHHNVPFYNHYPGEPTNTERDRRRKVTLHPRRIYLSSATLIIIPANLLSQWDREIVKHCEYPLRVLIMRSKTVMPDARVLASDYDVVLMTYTRFSLESRRRDVSKLHLSTNCTCPYFPGLRLPDCTCEVPDVSSLLRIRWKRLVIDEGHVSATLSTVLTPFTKMLSVERRWIVTGTPTTNLLGLSFGSNDIRVTLENTGNGNSSDFSSDEGSQTSSTDKSSSSTSRSDSQNLRVWTKYDREDLHKLGIMITHFIAVPQFASDPKLVYTHVTEPLLDPHGPRPGAIQILTQVMEMIMIRHRIEDVEEDVILPPVTHESVLLDLHPLVIKSYNAMQATIAINAVDSERRDQDYLFHPSNAVMLQLAVKNMSQLMFWSVDNGLYNVDQLLRESQGHFDRALERHATSEDIMLLNKAFEHIRLAAQDPDWRAIQTHEDIPYHVYNLNQSVYAAWTRMPISRSITGQSTTCLVHADRLLRLRGLILSRPLISVHDLEVAVYEKPHHSYEKPSKKQGGKAGRKASSHQESTANLTLDNADRKAAAPETLQAMRKDLDISMARLENDDDDIPPLANQGSHTYSNTFSTLVSNSQWSKIRIGPSISSKVNYIIDEVAKYSSKEKFLIFSESPLSLAHVSEALELLQVKFLRFTTQIPPQFREQLVLTFETSETYRVFLMELKHGARGLNLISASRVIFCEPVWQADVESQAIKRAHRIGQQRPITVKTLAIRGTAEENMVERRNILQGNQDKLPKVLEDVGMRHYIANPNFMEVHSELRSTIDLPLVNIQRKDPENQTKKLVIKIPIMISNQQLPIKRVRDEDSIDKASSIHTADTQKKKKSVRFA